MDPPKLRCVRPKPPKNGASLNPKPCARSRNTKRPFQDSHPPTHTHTHTHTFTLPFARSGRGRPSRLWSCTDTVRKKSRPGKTKQVMPAWFRGFLGYRAEDLGATFDGPSVWAPAKRSPRSYTDS